MTVRTLILAVAKAKAGVDWVQGKGAYCPCCRQRLAVYKTLKGKPRIRYCKCTTPDCPLNEMSLRVKAI